MWCFTVLPILNKYAEKYPTTTPDPERLYERIQEITPQLQKLLIPRLNRVTAELRKEVSSEVEKIVQAAFEER